MEYKECEGKVWRPVNIGVVLSGGQAPGGHNVIAGIYDFCKKVGGNMYGFRYGPRGVFTGKYVKIDDKFMDQYRNMGGFDMIGSGRDISRATSSSRRLHACVRSWSWTV